MHLENKMQYEDTYFDKWQSKMWKFKLTKGKT